MILRLLNSLQSIVDKIVNNNPLPSGEVANVYVGVCPKIDKENQNNKSKPFVLIKPVDGSGSSNESMLSVLMLVGSKSNDSEAWMDPLILIELIASHIVDIQIIDNYFERDDEIKWDFYESDTNPKWFAGLQLWFNAPGPFTSYGLKEIRGD